MPWYGWLVWGVVQLAFAVWIAGVSGRTKAASAQDDSDRQERLLNLYTQIEEMLDSFEEYVGEVHNQLEEKRAELVELNRQAQVMYLQALDASRQTAPPAESPAVQPVSAPERVLGDDGPAQAVIHKAAALKSGARNPERESQNGAGRVKTLSSKPSRLTDRDKEALGRFATKPQKVRFLMSRGLSLDEVARELDIGKGEVLLITDLDKT